jgi:hypothetical protein
MGHSAGARPFPACRSGGRAEVSDDFLSMQRHVDLVSFCLQTAQLIQLLKAAHDLFAHRILSCGTYIGGDSLPVLKYPAISLHVGPYCTITRFTLIRWYASPYKKRRELDPCRS